jgi:hypothetical protein
MLENQNAFQNAGQNGNFYYTAIGNQASTFLVLILAIIMLVALIRSERRYRELLEKLSSQLNPSE